METISGVLWTIALSSARFYAAMAACPLFSNSILPKFFKAILAIFLATVFFPHSHITSDEGVYFKLFLLSKEFLVGYAIGVLFSLPIWLVENIGNLIDAQRGEDFGATVNQITQSPSSSIAKLLAQGFNVYFVTANGLLFFISFIAKSFLVIPQDKLTFNLHASQEIIIHLFSSYFYWLIILALPVIFLMFILEISLGIFSSFIQQLNVTVISMPIKSLVALFILVFYLEVLYHVAMSKFMEHIYQTAFAF